MIVGSMETNRPSLPLMWLPIPLEPVIWDYSRLTPLHRPIRWHVRLEERGRPGGRRMLRGWRCAHGEPDTNAFH